MTSLQREVAELIVETLDLEMGPEEIQPEEPLFQDGLGLDSIDALELAMAISQKYDLKFRVDDEDNVKVFATLTTLSQFIEDNRGA